MDRQRPGVLEVLEHLRFITCQTPVKIHSQSLLFPVDFLQDPDIPVEDPGALAAVRALPQNVVVVAGLDQSVALPEYHAAQRAFFLLRRRRIQRRLQLAVQRKRAAVSLSGRGKHLDLFRRNLQLLRQPHTAELHNRLGKGAGLHPLQAEEVSGVLREIRVFAAVNHMGVAHDAASALLAEYLRQGHRRHHAAAQNGREHISRAYRGQL